MNVAEWCHVTRSRPAALAAGCSTLLSSFDSRNASPLRFANTGTVIDRIELQRASEGRPLDAIIVHAHDPSGTAAVLEIQVKREIAFSPADEVFRDVIQQIADAARRPDFRTSRYELAVATAKTSARISGPYRTS